MADVFPKRWVMRTRPDHAGAAALGWVAQQGQMDKSGRQPLAWRVLGSYALVYLHAGEGVYEDENRGPTRLAGGDILFVWPDLGHRYGPTGGTWRELFLVFLGPGFDAWDRPGLLDRRRPILRLPRTSDWPARITTVLDHRASGSPAVIEETTAMMRLLGDVFAAHARSTSPAADAELAEAQRLIDREASQTLRLEEVAETVGLSYAAFRRRFREAFGVSPGRYRGKRVIDRACGLMAETTLSDAQIAQRLGFADAFHFSKRFKQVAGRTPRAYRRSLTMSRPPTTP